MKVLETLKDKKVGLYLRKESIDENTTTGYGRLQWLKYELEEHKGEIDFFIDELKDNKNLLKLIRGIRNREIEVVIIWSIDDIELALINELWVICIMRGVPLISFYEGVIEFNDITNVYSKQFLIER